jgi:hypothetical protein
MLDRNRLQAGTGLRICGHFVQPLICKVLWCHIQTTNDEVTSQFLNAVKKQNLN